MSIKTVTTLSAGLLIGCCASTASAQSGKSFTAVSDNCDSVTWSAEALATYPTIASACQGVLEKNGKRYVKFEAKVKSVKEKGQRLVMDFKDGGEMTLTPGPEVVLSVDGKKTPISSLSRGDVLRFYVAEDRFAAQFPEVETANARYVIVPIVVPDHTQQLAALPHTAGPLPLLALMGSFSLGLGGLLSLSRRRRS